MTYEVNIKFGVKVLARGEDIHCLGKRDQCRTCENGIGAILYQGTGSKVGMTVSRHPSQQEKVKMQGKKAKEGVALGLEISAFHIQGNGVIFCPALKKTHLGLDPIYKPKKWFCRKRSNFQKGGQHGRQRQGLKITVFSDLGKQSHFQLRVEEDPLRA